MADFQKTTVEIRELHACVHYSTNKIWIPWWIKIKFGMHWKGR